MHSIQREQDAVPIRPLQPDACFGEVSLQSVLLDSNGGLVGRFGPLLVAGLVTGYTATGYSGAGRTARISLMMISLQLDRAATLFRRLR